MLLAAAAQHTPMYYIIWATIVAGLINGYFKMRKADKEGPPPQDTDSNDTGWDNGYRESRRGVFDLFK